MYKNKNLHMKKISKIIDFKELSQLRNFYKNKKLVLAHGTFDFFHYGHFLHLKKAKSLADILIVTLTADKFVKKGPGRPFYDQKTRLNYLKELNFIDHISIANFSTGLEVIKKLKPNIYVKGNDYKNLEKDFTGKIKEEIKLVKKNGGKFLVTNEKSFSSSNKINLFKDEHNLDTKKFLNNFKKENNFESIRDQLKKISSKRILLLGETILDEYIFTKTMAKSPKEEIISVQELNKKIYLGGILASASQICEFPKEIEVLTLFGKDKNLNNFVKNKLNKKIKLNYIHDRSRETIIKTRFLEHNKKQKLFQNNKLDIQDIKKSTEAKFINYLKKNHKKFDCIMINDFGHGMITEKIRNFIIKNFKNIFVNVQTNSSNLGYNLITKYKSCSYFTVDEPEARLATKNRFSDTTNLFTQIRKKMKFNSGSITFGDKGVHSYHNGKVIYLPALTKSVVDTLGAGDAFFAYSSMFKLVSKNIKEISFVGNLAAAIKIQHLGHEKFITKEIFYQYLKNILA